MTATVDVTPATRSRVQSWAHLPGLDGVRAIAVMAVLIFHADPTWLPGGFLGVDVFFALSGFLITSLLLAELSVSGEVNFRRFYVRRARRLLPALFAVLVVTAVLAMTVAQDAAERVRQDSIAAFFYVTNWWYIVHGTSYFDSTERPPLLQHLWSLAVEEQFYFIWPILLYGLWRWGRRSAVRWGALVGAVASTAAMIAISVSRDIPSVTDSGRVYFGTDTHAMTLLLGAVLATVWLPFSRRSRLTASGLRAMSAIGFAGLVLLIGIFAFVSPDSSALFRGGFAVVGLASVALVAGAATTGTWFSRALANQPLKYLGERSYGLYLWHWPIFMVLRPGVDLDADGPGVQVIRFALTFAVAELSYRFLEMPIRGGAIGRMWSGWRAAGTATTITRGTIALVVALGLITTVGIGLSRTHEETFAESLGGVEGVGDGELTPLPSASAMPSPVLTPSPQPSAITSSTPSPTATVAKVPLDLTKTSMILVGDSVLLGARGAVQAMFPQARVDAAVSRQSEAVFDRILARIAVKRIGKVVVIHTGTNGVIDRGHLVRLLQQLKDRARVILVTVHANRPWVASSNAAIRAAAAQFKNGNVRLADWNALATGHRSWLFSDGIHMRAEGAKQYAALLRRVLSEK